MDSRIPGFYKLTVQAGASGDLVDEVAERMVEDGTIREDRAAEISTGPT